MMPWILRRVALMLLPLVFAFLRRRWEERRARERVS
jgi:hypothetical protein